MRDRDLQRQLEKGRFTQSAEPFRWKRKKNGYEIVHGFGSLEVRFGPSDSLQNPQLWLTERAAVRSQPPEEYSPDKENPALFREAAALDLSPESIAKFANSWGLFTAPARFVRCTREDLKRLTPNEIQKITNEGLSIVDEVSPLRALKWTVAAWDAYKSNSTAKARAFFRQAAQGSWALIWQSPMTGNTEVLSLYARNPPFREILLHWIQTITNIWLESASTPMLLRNENGAFKLRFVARDLIGCLWVQFAETIAGDIRHKPCPVCSKSFPVSRGLGRPDKKYCGPTCRKRAHRNRKADS